MLTVGINHVATITNDSDRLQAFYQEVFEAEILRDGSEFPDGSGPRLSVIKIGPYAELNVFEIDGNTQADVQTPMFGRGRLDHFAHQAESISRSAPPGRRVSQATDTAFTRGAESTKLRGRQALGLFEKTMQGSPWV